MIRRTAEFIETGSRTGNYHNCIGQSLREEMEELGDSLSGSESDPRKGCMDFGAVLMDVSEDGTICVRYPVPESARNRMKNLQGGVMASFIDNAMAIAVVPTYGAFMTMNLDVNYFAPVSAEYDEIEIRVSVIKPGNHTKYLRAEVYRSDGRLAALAGSTIMMVHDKQGITPATTDQPGSNSMKG